MQRSNSWPQLLISEAVEKGITESNPDNQQVHDLLLERETECKDLRSELADWEAQYNALANTAEQTDIANQFLTKENESLKEERKVNSDRLQSLEREQSRLKLQIRELECFISNLQKNYD